MLKVSSCIKFPRNWVVDQQENTFKIELFNTIGKRTWKFSLKYCFSKYDLLKYSSFSYNISHTLHIDAHPHTKI